MNNSKIALENIEEEQDADRLSILQRQQGEISQVVEAINRVEVSEDWQKLKKLVFDGVLESLERQLYNAASGISNKEIDAPELYRLQGQLVWARKYADLKKLSDVFRQQLETIKNQIKHEQTNPRDGAL